MHPKDADGIANSVDPDQTASWSALFDETYLSQYIEFVRYFDSNYYNDSNYRDQKKPQQSIDSNQSTLKVNGYTFKLFCNFH